MTTVAPQAPSTAALPVPRTEKPSDPSRGLTLRLGRPTSTSVVVHLAGELDTSTTPRLHELLAPRLSSTAEVLILDVSEVTFLGVAGLELMNHTHRRAHYRGMALCLVGAPICVDRALTAAGWNALFPRYATVTAAVTDLSRRPHQKPRQAEPA